LIFQGVRGVGGRCGLGIGFSAYLWVFLRCGAQLGCHDNIADRLGEALVLRWAAFLLLQRRSAE
jgi:hypothetical protein